MSEESSPTANSQSPGPLHGIRVIECGHMVAAAYAGKLMADLGAEVIKVEEPGGDNARQRGPYPGNTRQSRYQDPASQFCPYSDGRHSQPFA